MGRHVGSVVVLCLLSSLASIYAPHALYPFARIAWSRNSKHKEADLPRAFGEQRNSLAGVTKALVPRATLSAVPRRSDVEARKITSSISLASTVRAVLDIMATQMDETLLNEYHLAAAVTRIAHLHGTEAGALGANPVFARLLEKLQEALEVEALQARQLANVIWAAVTMKEEVPELLALMPQLTQSLQGKVKYLNMQESANVLWAAGTVGQENPELKGLAPAIMASLPSRAEQMPPRQIFMIVVATGRLGLTAAEKKSLLPSVLGRVHRLIRHFDGRDLATMVASLAACSHRNATFLKLVADRVVATAPDWPEKSVCSNLPKLACSFATLNASSISMMTTIQDMLEPWFGQLSSWSIAALLKSYDALDTQN